MASPLLAASTGALARPVGRVRRWSSGREALVLMLGVAAFALALGPGLRETGTPPAWDQSVHLRDSLIYEHIVRHPSALGGGVFGQILHGSEEYPLLTPSGYYPPLVLGVSALLYLVAGRSYAAAMATQILFLALLILGTWGLGNRLLGRPAGLLAGLMLLAAPGIRLSAGEYMLDLPLAALVVVAAWMLLASDGFGRLDRSLAFGLLAGAGMLIKWTFFLFLAVPVAWCLVSGLAASQREPRQASRRWVHLILALLAGAAVAAPYYLPILPILVMKTVVHAGGAADGFASPFTLDSLRFHLEALPRKLFGWPLTITALAGMLAFLRSDPKSDRSRRFLLSWALVLYAIFTFAVANKQSRYLLPWMPVLLLMAAGGLSTLWSRLGSGWSRGRLAAGALALLPVAGLYGGWRAEETGDWHIRPLVVRLEEQLAGLPQLPDRAWRLGVIPDMREVNGPTIAYYAARRDLPVTVVQLVNRMKRHVDVEVGLDPFDRKDFFQAFDEYDFIVTKSGENAISPWEAVVPRMQAYFQARIASFDLLASFQEPDGSTLALYGKRRS
jgi:4-amino-4-deoxy-L-arabinose transferase-like glycosyltransferase